MFLGYISLHKHTIWGLLSEVHTTLYPVLHYNPLSLVFLVFPPCLYNWHLNVDCCGEPITPHWYLYPKKDAPLGDPLLRLEWVSTDEAVDSKGTPCWQLIISFTFFWCSSYRFSLHILTVCCFQILGSIFTEKFQFSNATGNSKRWRIRLCP